MTTDTTTIDPTDSDGSMLTDDDTATSTDPVEDTASAAEPEPPAAPAEPARRARGQLEADVKIITDKFTLGKLDLPEGAAMTPHFIALALQKEDSLESPPSTGAVAAILNRWKAIGYITTAEKPFSFSGYTQAAYEQGGLAALKAIDAAKKKETRAAAKNATVAAEATPAVEPADATAAA